MIPSSAPEVSVLLCTYNGMPFLREAVDSVLASVGCDFELVVVDDGSEDNTRHFLSTVNDPRLRVFYLDDNSGIATAANFGITQCRADLIARLDADDRMPAGRLKSQVRFLRLNPDIGVVASRAELTQSDFRQDGYRLYVEWSNRLLSDQDMRAQRFRDSPVINPSVCFRKELADHFGGYRKDVPEDYEFWLRLWERGIRFAKLKETGVIWRDHASRLTRNHSDYSEESFAKVKTEYFALEWKRRPKPVLIWGKSRNARDWHRRLVSAGIQVKGFIDFDEGEWKSLPVRSIEQALAMDEIFYLIAVRDRKGVNKIFRALSVAGKKPAEDYYFL